MEALLMEKLSKMEETMLAFKGKQEGLEARFEKEPDTAPSLNIAGSSDRGKELLEMRSSLNALEASFKELKALIERTDERLDGLEQYGRRNCLVLHGCQGIPKNRDQFLKYILNIFNKMNLPYPIVPAEIDIAHVLPTKENRTPIIVKFLRRMVRNDIFNSKRCLKGTKMAITESLTARRLRIVEKAKEVFGFRSVWTFNGAVHIIHNNKRVCPEPELKALYEKEIERKDDFSKEDRFMMELCQIPRLGLRLEALTIIRELPQEIEDLQPAVELALNSLEELSNSQLLEKSLAYILAVANQINCTNAKGTAKGIRLSSLQKTCVMRTNDRKQTLLNVVVDIVEKHEPEVLQLADELKSLTKSQAYSTKGLSAEIDIMRKSVFKVRKNCELLRRKKHQPTNEDLAFCNGVEAILTELDADIKQLNDKCVEIKKTLSRVLLKFGESSETDTQDLFSWIREFISNFKKTSL